MDFSKDYDSHKGLEESLKSLETFNQIKDARYQAGYTRNERLSEWIVLGRFVLDSCGNFSKINPDYSSPAEKFPYLHSVILLDSYLNLYCLQKDDYICYSPSWLPPAKQICPVCNQGWTVENCHDFVDSHTNKVVDLTPFIGQTIAYFKTNWNQSSKVIWSIQSEKSLQNKRYIDHTIENSEFGKEYNWQVNKLGWVEANDDHFIESGDRIMVNTWTMRHQKCYRSRQAKMERTYFKRIFLSAGYHDIQMTQIPNQYHGDSNCTVCAPWYEVVADKISFTIGWRKRVISIEVKDPNINLLKIFPKEDVTKEKDYIHAWGRKKCVEYLSTIRNNLLTK